MLDKVAYSRGYKGLEYDLTQYPLLFPQGDW